MPIKRLGKKIPIPRRTQALPLLALRTVTSKNGAGVYASSDTLFKGAIFGRDSLEVAEDLLRTKRRMVKQILLTLARLQGETSNDMREEEPGKIVHEYRSVIVDGKRIDDMSMRIFKELSHKWGGNKTEMAYYGSVDATPHYLRVLGAYCDMYGVSILDEKIVLRSGGVVTMRNVMENAAIWLLQQLKTSRSGLIEYQRRNPHGLENQVWKDSAEFYVHENKEMANHKGPIASIEVQGLAYDALKMLASFMPERADEFRDHAAVLRDRTIELLWQEDRRYFALGLDYSTSGKMRIIHTSTANPAALLDTEFFDDLNETDRHKYVKALVIKIMSDDFLTDAGIRSRALSAAHLIEFWDYHGSYVTWPKETYDIAKGLRRQGFPTLARELENRLLNVILKNREYPEFVYVDGWGRVLASSPSAHSHGETVLIDSINKPERIQAWTVAAVIAIISQRIGSKLRKGSPAPTRADWQIALEKKVLTHMPRVDRLLSPNALKARYPTYKYHLAKIKYKDESIK
jgi:glycogen debranching enzyme